MVYVKKQAVIISHLKCSKCGHLIPIPRKRGKLRENMHIKHMYCPFCKSEQAFVEDKILNY